MFNYSGGLLGNSLLGNSVEESAEGRHSITAQQSALTSKSKEFCTGWTSGGTVSA